MGIYFGILGGGELKEYSPGGSTVGVSVIPIFAMFVILAFALFMSDIPAFALLLLSGMIVYGLHHFKFLTFLKGITDVSDIISTKEGDATTMEEAKKSNHVARKVEKHQEGRQLDAHIEEQFGGGRLLACITSHPGQCGRCNGKVSECADWSLDELTVEATVELRFWWKLQSFFHHCRNQSKLQQNLMYLAAIADSQPQPPTMHAHQQQAMHGQIGMSFSGNSGLHMMHNEGNVGYGVTVVTKQDMGSGDSGDGRGGDGDSGYGRVPKV
ncbi:hypothetical protein GIB67_016487 [Kingdonia uniflora]|uniref:Uncharacterized protein n=1 Tax=Kingdonia uniflora TaxID=39325 RepID=A0A7J7M802_9MAGN|nr:hypothetical protein GIB67_016487 [Kingdonia uniflora]